MLAKTDELVPFIKDFEQKIEKRAGGSDPFKALRASALDQLSTLAWPTSKTEDWRFTSIAPILNSSFDLAAVEKYKVDDLYKRYTDNDTIKIVFVNGYYSQELSKTKDLPKGVTVKTLSAMAQSESAWLQKNLNRFDIKDEKRPFGALNKAAMQDGVVIKLDDNVVCKDLIHVIFLNVTNGKSVAMFPRNLIIAGKSSEANLLESHLSFDDKQTYLSVPLTEIFVAENAHVNYSKAQKESFKSYHLGTTRVLQERNSSFNGFSLGVGAALSRHDLDIILDGEGSAGMLNGLYSPSDNQLVDNHTCVEHRKPNCQSNQLYKGILNGSAKAVFNGKILVSSIAQQTNSYQLNKNLLLGKDSQVNTKPQLEIEADDVKCTHGATIGQLNEDEIFYLQSRCISKKEAVKMLAVGFVDDVLNHISSEAVIAKFHLLLEPSFAAL